MWGDEAETALYARRILKFGYPKVHDGKNTYDQHMVPGDVAVIKKYDLYSIEMWGQYYFGAIGEYFAQQTTDFYSKTAILRSSFAIMGILGIFILPILFFLIFKNSQKKLLALLLYIIIQLFSISLILHIREVRSYSLSVFLSSLSILFFYIYNLKRKINSLWYFLLLLLTLFLLGNTFPPAYLGMTVSFVTYILLKNFNSDLSEFVKNILKKETLIALSPIVLSVFLYLPIIIFFETSKAAQAAFLSMNYNLSVYKSYLLRIIVFLAKYHLLYIAIYLKIIRYFQSKGNKKQVQENQLKEYDKLSFLLTLILIVNLFTIPMTPFLFERYFVFLQPLLSMIVVVDLFGVYEFIKGNNQSDQGNNVLAIHFYIIFLLFILTQITNFDNLKGHIYELTHKYEGPMDKVIFYIKDKYPHPENISIFTPIEQTELIYYLNSKVLCDDSINCYKDPPDIFIPRNYLSSKDLWKRYDNYIKEARYSKITLDIRDYPVNNIPEFSLTLRHLYKTPFESDPNYQLYLYVKE
ncbi:hypothetical protein A2159_01375 [Candidatus Woesebacteria bacterium RBG_13_34_9]|nr:MAG: hypothetical protein A2159_01375 [Candidatus Woesebacteria bacterium RBG_13_34_9]